MSKRPCLNCGKNPAKIFYLDDEPVRMFCSYRCAASDAISNRTSYTADVAEWCDRCGWIAAEDRYWIEKAHQEHCERYWTPEFEDKKIEAEHRRYHEERLSDLEKALAKAMVQAAKLD